MAMKQVAPAASPAAYLAALDGWRATLAGRLRRAVRAAGDFDERIRWGHLVYAHAGPAVLIRVEDARVLFRFWRGRRLRDLEPRLKAGGKYEMATLVLHEGDTIAPAAATALARAAIALNRELGDPTDVAGTR